MATIAATIRWATNTEDLIAKLRSGEDAVFALEGAAQKTARALGGEGLIRAANNAAAAVSQLGGIEKLTGDESARFATLIEKANAKIQQMGGTAPSDFAKLSAGARAAADQAKRLGDETAAVQRQVQAFSGGKVIQEATQMARAIEQVGGANKLTAAEQVRVNATVTEAIAKYKALGQEAPADLLKLQTSTKAIVDPTAALNQRLTDMQGTLRSVGSQARSAGVGLTAGLTLPIVGALTASAQAAIGFESTFAGVRKTVDGVVDSAGELTTFGQTVQREFRGMAKAMPESVENINRVGEAAGQLGIKKENIVSFTATMVKMGETTNLSAEQAAVGMARLTNILGTTQDKVSNLASAIVALGNDGASTEQEILELALRIGGAGKAVGMTEGDVLGLANAMSSLGIEAEMGGTAMQKSILSVAKAVSAGGAAVTEFAKIARVTNEEFIRLFKIDPGQAFAKFLQGLSDIKRDGGDLIAVLDKLGIEEARLLNTMLRVGNSGTMVADSMRLGNRAFEENAALNKEYEQRLKTTSAQLTILWNNVHDLGIEAERCSR